LENGIRYWYKSFKQMLGAFHRKIQYGYVNLHFVFLSFLGIHSFDDAFVQLYKG